MSAVYLKEAELVQVVDYRVNAKDAFSVLIEGEMIDYLVDEASGDIIDGDEKVRSFSERWRFCR